MKVLLESTTKTVMLRTENGVIPARIWEGETESGIPVHCYITRVVIAADADATQFETELQQCRVPSPEINALPLSLIL